MTDDDWKTLTHDFAVFYSVAFVCLTIICIMALALLFVVAT